MARASARRSPRCTAAISASDVTRPSVASECGFALRRLLLARPHSGIDATTQQQFPMMAALDDASAVEHQDLVGVDDGRQPMGDDEGRAIGGDLGEARLDLAL